MNTKEQRRFRIGSYRVDLDLNRVARNGSHVSLPPKAAAVLGELIRARGRVVHREALLETVWPNTVPTDDILTQAIRELRLAFGDSATDSHTIETIPKVGYRLVRPCVPETEKPRHRIRVLSVAVLAMLLAVVASWIMWSPDNPQATVNGPTAPELDVRPFITDVGRDASPRFSRDGEWLAYVHEIDDVADLFIRRVSGGEARRLTETPAEFEHAPAWSPEGGQIAYNVRKHKQRCEIRIMDLESGASRPVRTDCIQTGPTFVDWSPDGEWIAYSAYEAVPGIGDDTRVLAIRLVSPDGAQSRRVSFAPDYTYSDIRPTFSPDSQQLLFVRARSDGLRELIVLDLSAGEETRVNPNDLWVITARWADAPDTFITAAHKSTLLRMFTLHSATGVVTELNIRGARDLDVDLVNRRIVYTTSESDTNIWRFDPVTGEAKLVSAAMSTVPEGMPVFVADGSLMFVSMRSGMWEIWRVRPGAEAAERVTFSEHAGVVAPQLSPDGRTLLYMRRDTDGSTLYWQDMETGEAEPVPGLDELRITQAAWTPDGCCLIYIADVFGYWQLWRRDLRGGPAEQWVADSVDAFRLAADGTLVLKLEKEPGLHRFDPSTRTLEVIVGTGGLWSSQGFEVTRDGIYLLESRDSGPQLVLLRADGTRDVLTGLPRVASGRLAVDPGDQSLYFVRADKRESDIYLARLAPSEVGLAQP